MLSTNRHAVGHNLVLAMKRQLTNFDYFATFRQSTLIAYSLWERADGMQYDQQTAEWTSKLVEYQLEAADKLDAGKLRDKLIKALSWFHTKDLCGRQISPIDVMNRIEKIFVDTGDMKTQNNRFLVKTWFAFAGGFEASQSPIQTDSKAECCKSSTCGGTVALYYYAWEYF